MSGNQSDFSDNLRNELALAVQTANSEIELSTKIVHFAIGAVPTIGAIAVALIQLNSLGSGSKPYFIFQLPYAVKAAVGGLLAVAALILMLSSRCFYHVRRRYTRALRVAAQIREKYPDCELVPALVDECQRLQPYYERRSSSFAANLGLSLLFGGAMAACTAWFMASMVPGWLTYGTRVLSASLLAFAGYTMGLQAWFVRSLLTDDHATGTQNPPELGQVRLPRLIRDMADRQKRNGVLGFLSLMMIGCSAGTAANLIVARGLGGRAWLSHLLVATATRQWYGIYLCVLVVVLLLFVGWFPTSGTYLKWWGYGQMPISRTIAQTGSLCLLIMMAAVVAALLSSVEHIHAPYSAAIIRDRTTFDPGGRFVSGTAHLPQGSELRGCLIRDNTLLALVTCEVVNNAWCLSLLGVIGHPLPPGHYVWTIEFDPETQIQPVREFVGAKGQFLVDERKNGSQVVQVDPSDPERKRLRFRCAFTIPPKAVVIPGKASAQLPVPKTRSRNR